MSSNSTMKIRNLCVMEVYIMGIINVNPRMCRSGRSRGVACLFEKRPFDGLIPLSQRRSHFLSPLSLETDNASESKLFSFSWAVQRHIYIYTASHFRHVSGDPNLFVLCYFDFLVFFGWSSHSEMGFSFPLVSRSLHFKCSGTPVHVS